MRVLVCGGRSYCDWPRLCELLDRLEQPVTAIIHGAAPGADLLAGQWAKLRGIDEVKFPARWELHGRAAGPIRNQLMIDKGRPDMVVAFPGGRGTADMVRRAKAAGVYVLEL